MDPAKEKEVEEEYLSSLMDLNVNSKPLINMLTMLAEDNLECAHVIVRAIEKHITQVQPDAKLPILYLIDSIVKNVGDKYKQLFAQNIVSIFCEVFKKVNEKVRERMFNLRQTWNEVFPQTKLYALDVKVNVMDNNWPITAKVVPKSVHVNPNFLKSNPEVTKASQQQQPPPKDILYQQMQAKERELLELKQRKIELELMVTKKKIADQEKEIHHATKSIPPTIKHSAVQQHHQLPNNNGRVRIAPVSAAMVSSVRSRDPRLLKMRSPLSETSVSTKEHGQPSVLLIPPTNSIRSLPRIPKHSTKSTTAVTSREDRDDRDPRKRRDDKINKSDLRGRSSTSKSSSSSVKKSSNHESPKKRSDEEKRSSKNSHKSSKSHSSHSRSPYKNGSETTEISKDVDLRIIPMDVDMRPDSTTAAAAAAAASSSLSPDSKLNKNKLLNDLLQDEDMRSSQDSMISTSNEESSQLPKCDTDLRFLEQGKKRSMSNDSPEIEPNTKKNRTENADILFGNEDVDLRSSVSDTQQQTDKKMKKCKSDFEAVRAKLNASKARSKTSGIKLLEELPSMPVENGASELVKKMLQRKKGDTREHDENPEAHNEQRSLVNQTTTSVNDEINVNVNVSTRKEKRKETKWSQPTMPPATVMPWVNPVQAVAQPPARIISNATLSSTSMMPHHFTNPWETNPMVIAMQKASQMPLVIPQSCHQPVLNNKMRTLRLDGIRDHLLRFYGEVAIIFNESGEAHDIRFSSGQSKVVIDDMYSVILNFNDSYKSVMIEGLQHQIKFGTPTRELYVDDNFYECYFNNQTTQIILGNKVRRVRIEGNAPEVKIGQRRNDIVLGLINMMIDAEIVVPVFLDTTEQYFEYKNQIFTLQFADFFLSVIINNEPFKVEFGGLPKNYMLNGQKHFIRFTVLPDEVVPGQVNMRGMKRTNLFRNCKSPPLKDYPQIDINRLVENDMAMPPHIQTSIPPPSINENHDQSPLNISDLLQKLVATGIIGNTAVPSTAPPTNNTSNTTSVNSTQNERQKDKNKKDRVEVEVTVRINPVILTRPETIKKRQQAIVDSLYTGIQCGSCGLRFSPEQTVKYSQHLDWHFRQNRRERDSKRRAHSRKWYYNRSDWIRYEEIEDADAEREKNFFETQQLEAMDQGGEDGLNMGRSNVNQAISCPAGPDDVNRCCDMCHDQFEQFFNEETEEWHLRSAIKVEDKIFHPICYEDYKTSLTLDESALNMDNSSQVNEEDDDDEVEMSDSVVIVKEEKNEDEKKETQSAAVDDDDVIVLPPEEPVVTEIQDEEESESKTEKMETDQVVQTLNATDDDVMIQEPKIQVYHVYDDDDEERPEKDQKEISHTPLIVKIKEEPKDDGYEEIANEEDAFVEVTSINEDFINDDTHSPFHPAALDENAIFDESSLLMSSNAEHDDYLHDDQHTDDGSSRPDSNNAPAVVGGSKKLKIVLSSLAQQNQLTNKINSILNSQSNVNDQNIDASSNSENVNKLDSNSLVDLQKQGAAVTAEEGDAEDQHVEEKEIAFEIKPHLRDFKFEKNTMPVKRGFENSGLCSIM